MDQLLPFLPEAWRGYALTLFASVGAARFLVKPFGELIRRAILRAAETAIASAGTDDDHWIETLLATRTYRVAAFALDYLASVKLPRAEDLFLRAGTREKTDAPLPPLNP